MFLGHPVVLCRRNHTALRKLSTTSSCRFWIAFFGGCPRSCKIWFLAKHLLRFLLSIIRQFNFLPPYFIFIVFTMSGEIKVRILIGCYIAVAALAATTAQ